MELDFPHITAEEKTAIRNQSCGTCKWHIQGQSSMQCFNPEQKDDNLRGYTYHGMWCPLHTSGKFTEEQLREMGYERKISDTGSGIQYWAKTENKGAIV